jgi:hypothetical protein
VWGSGEVRTLEALVVVVEVLEKPAGLVEEQYRWPLEVVAVLAVLMEARYHYPLEVVVKSVALVERVEEWYRWPQGVLVAALLAELCRCPLLEAPGAQEAGLQLGQG